MLLGDLASPLEVPGRDVAGEPVLGVVRDLDRLVVARRRAGSRAPARRSPRVRWSCRCARCRRRWAARSSRARGPSGRPGPPAASLAPSSMPAWIRRWILSNCTSLTTGPEHRAVAERIADAHRLGRGLGDLDGGVVLAARHQHAGGRVAGLAAVQEAGAHAAAHRRLPGRRRRAGCWPTSRRAPASRASRVGAAAMATATPARVEPVNDIMSTPGCDARAWPTVGPSPFTRLNTPAGHAGLVQDLRQHQRVERGDLARLQHHRAARRQRREDLAGDLVHRPVPRRDEAAHADRLAAHAAWCRARCSNS